MEEKGSCCGLWTGSWVMLAVVRAWGGNSERSEEQLVAAAEAVPLPVACAEPHGAA
jgi:hypothetical protein